ncbi:MAG TPA: DUF1570 domain-containing protein [Vicinamibacterales bacterium]|jgi:hypothetical protein
MDAIVRCRSRRAPAIAAALLAIAMYAGRASAEPRWIRVDTPNVVIVGAEGERRLADVGAQFEAFREALTRRLSPTATSSPVPTVVIEFPDDRSFAPFKPVYRGQQVNVGGLFASRSEVNYILIGPSRSGDDLSSVFHEYSHLVIDNLAPGMPLWLNEGLAEYFSTFRIERGGRAIAIGQTIDDHLQRLAREAWLPLDTLLATTETSPEYNENARRGVFYAESWALTHLLLEGQPDRSAALGRYVSDVLAGVHPADAWARAFARDDVMGALRS